MLGRPAIAEYPPGARLPPRVIHDFEFVWLLSGQARFHCAPRPLDLVLTPGRLLLVPPGLRHRFDWDPIRPTRHGYVHFDPADPALGTKLDREPAPRVRLVPMTGQDPLSGLCAHLIWLGAEAHDDREEPAARTLAFMIELIVSEALPGLRPPPGELSPLVRAAIDYLHRQWSRPPLRRVPVTELAAAVPVSRGHLNRLVQKSFGMGAATALERLRLARAEPLLAHTNLTISVIARECGFADLSHFSHRFTTTHGMPPSAYRATGIGSPSVLDHPGLRRLNHLIFDQDLSTTSSFGTSG